MKPSFVDETGEYHYFHTLVGNYSSEHFEILQAAQGKWDERWDYFKIRNFLAGPNNVEEMEAYLGLSHREIMCTFSKTRNAVTYHLPFGLVMSGEPRLVFNNDSGLSLSKTGKYEGKHFDFTSEVTLQELASTYASKYRETIQAFSWDEVVLKSGSTIAAAFHDPNLSDLRRRQRRREAPENEYEEFIAKCKKLGIPILSIDARLK